LKSKVVGLIAVTSVALVAALGFVVARRAPVVPPGVRLVVTGEDGPTPCRIYLKNERGEPAAPPGLPFYEDHFAFGGSGRLDLTPGSYRYEIERGPEYRPATGSFSAPADDAHPVAVKLERLVNLAARGYYAGDLHVHRPLVGGELVMRAEDLTVGGFISWWNDRPAAVADHLRERVTRFDGTRWLDPTGGEDERQGGALLFFRLKEALLLPHLYYENGNIAHRAGAEADEYPSPVELARAARAQGDVHIALEKPFWWDTPTWVALGLVDSVGIAHNHMERRHANNQEAWGRPCDRSRYGESPFANAYCTQDIYYRLLDSGFRLAPSAGSASGALPNPVGYDRVYVETGTPPDLDAWWRLLGEGRSFVTNGPLLVVHANGKPAGSVFGAAADERVALELSVELASADPIAAVEVVQNGSVTARGVYDTNTGRVALPPVVFDRSGWCLVRALAARSDTFRFASTAPFYVEIGTVPRRISRSAVEYFRRWLDERLARLEKSDLETDKLSLVVAPHLEAKRVWDDRLAHANAD
jgi:hypothetical protein